MTVTATIHDELAVQWDTPEDCNQKTAEFSLGGVSLGVVEIEEVPASFFDALADIRHGRLVDMEVALNEPPPSSI